MAFVGHGLFDPTRPLPAGLSFSGSSLWSSEILDIESSPPLVVLAACEAGRGLQRRGEDGATLMAGSWFQRGSRCIVHSAFQLEEQAAYRIVEQLGRGLREQASVAEALRSARVAVSGERDHPFYFGLVQAVGYATR